MTPAEEYLQKIAFKEMPDTVPDIMTIMNNFAYETLKQVLKDIKEIKQRNSSEEMHAIIVEYISNLKEKYHQYDMATIKEQS